MGSLGLILVGVLSSIVGGMIANEVYAWIPRVSRCLVDSAVRLLPNHKRRADEEWHAHLDDLPNSSTKLLHAVGCVTTSIYMRLRRRWVYSLNVEIELEGDAAAQIEAEAAKHNVSLDVIWSALIQQQIDRQQGTLEEDDVWGTLPNYIVKAKRTRFALRWFPWVYNRSEPPDE